MKPFLHHKVPASSRADADGSRLDSPQDQMVSYRQAGTSTPLPAHAAGAQSCCCCFSSFLLQECFLQRWCFVFFFKKNILLWTSKTCSGRTHRTAHHLQHLPAWLFWGCFFSFCRITISARSCAWVPGCLAPGSRGPAGLRGQQPMSQTLLPPAAEGAEAAPRC